MSLLKEFATLREPVKRLVFTMVINETSHLEGAAPGSDAADQNQGDVGCVRGQR